MNPPGARLRQFAARLFPPRAMEHVIDPLLADLQAEHRDALRDGFVWRARWVRLAGYFVFLRTVALVGWAEATGINVDRAVDDRHATGLVIQLTVAVVMAASLLIAVPALVHASRLHLLRAMPNVVVANSLTLLPITLPVGLMFGVLFGLRPYALSRGVIRSVLAMACVCAFASFVLSGWVLPLTRDAAVSASNAKLPLRPRVGPDQLTSPELIHEATVDKQMAIDARDAAEGRIMMKRSREFAATFEARWALTLGALSLPLFALMMVAGSRERLFLCGAGCTAVVVFGYVLTAAGSAFRSGIFPAFAVVWLPNLGITALMVAALVLRRRFGRPIGAPTSSVDGTTLTP
jgi:hypothetical protein